MNLMRLSYTRIGRRRLGDIVLSLVMVALTLAILYPMVGMVSLSLRRNAELMQSHSLIPQNPTLHNYVNMWRIAPFPLFFRNSLILALGTVCITGVLAAAAGYALNRFRFRGRGAIQLWFIYSQILPLVILIVPVYILMRIIGLYNTLAGLLVVYVGITLPFATLLMRGFYGQLPLDIEEACLVDGASRFQAWWHVALPLVRPGLLATAIFTFMAVWEELLIALTLTGSTNVRTFPIGLTYFFQQFESDYAGFMAAATVSCIPAMILFGILGRYFVRGIASGSVKG
jgi:ABC-type glycerol-3-phosphate transport system permease component